LFFDIKLLQLNAQMKAISPKLIWVTSVYK